jgi:uncharacterized OB-fold protein
MSTIKRVVPAANSYTRTQPFWDGTKEGRLMVQRCDATGRLQWPPRPVSIYTGRSNLSWVAVSGKAVLYSWTVTRSPWPGHEDRVPYVCAYAKLDEGIRVLCNLVDCKPEDLTLGMPLQLTWDYLDEGAPYPAFKPATIEGNKA